jgi:Ni/Fe-hydrogenase subunit HybB-like protein
MSDQTAFISKLLICGVVVTVAIGFMAQLLWPGMSVRNLTLYVLAGWGVLAGLMLLIVGITAIGGWVNQWILRNGGTDTQWLWFSADPPGLNRDSKIKQP